MASGAFMQPSAKMPIQRTDVVLTPQSNDGVVGEGAGGVSIHSKFSSEVDLLILLMVLNFANGGARRCRGVAAKANRCGGWSVAWTHWRAMRKL